MYVLGRLVLLGLVVAASSTSTTAKWSAYLGLAAAVAASIVSFHDHRLSVRPSSVLVLYLTASLALDIVSLAGPLQPRWKPFYWAMCVQAVAKLVLVLLECKSKSAILQDKYRSLPPEDLASILSLTYFWWLHDLLRLGFSKVLSPDDLPRIDTQLDAERLRQKILVAWGQRGDQADEQSTTLPTATASLSSFERIQAYLLKHDVGDARHLAGPEALGFKDVTIAGQKSLRNALEIEELALEKGSLIIVAGPVGSGKSLMLHAALGEVPLSTGSIRVSSKNISFCSQTAWLPNRTVRECILGLDSTVTVDQTWYETVLDACCLHEDLRDVADGHDTVVGTNGQDLSGGQRQRVAIARAVYARNEIVVFDDSFSALDAKTQKTVVDNLFGPAGLLRRAGTTVLWAVNSGLYIHLGDTVVILAEGRVQYHGSKDALKELTEVEATATATDSSEHDDAGGQAPQLGKEINTNPKPAAVPISNDHRKDGDLSLYSKTPRLLFYAVLTVQRIILPLQGPGMSCF